MPVKKGYKTTEFWLTVVAAILPLLYASGLIGEGTTIDKIISAGLTVLAALGYSVARGIAKKGNPE